MNYYERHLGDYARDTAHLSMLEHGAYTALLDRYYATEEPIPADQVHRVARARSRDEKAAVDAVLAEFFTLEADGWHSKRADAVIAEFKDSEPERAAKRENGKERVRRCRERRKAIFDTLREHGVVPDFDTPMAQLEAVLKRVTSEPVTRYATAIHTPDTSNQEEQKQKAARTRAPACPEDVDSQTWGDWLALRKAKRAPVTETVIREARAESAKAGMTFGQFLAVWCRRGSQGLEADWLKPNERAGPTAKHGGFNERDYGTGGTL